MDIWNHVATIAKDITAIAAGVALIIGVVRAWFKTKDGMKCLLRADMMKTYYHNSKDEKIRQYEKENFKYEYAAYKALGGNSFIDDINEKVKDWEIVP